MARPPLTHVLADREEMAVECVVMASGQIPALEFLNELQLMRLKTEDEFIVTAFSKMITLFKLMASHGGLSIKRFRPEMKGLHAFCHEIQNVQIRFPCFRDGNAWIITHGFKKRGAAKKLGVWPQAQVDRAIRIRDEYSDRKKQLTDGNNT